MNENILDIEENNAETGTSDTELVGTGTEHGADSLEHTVSGSDCVTGSSDANAITQAVTNITYAMEYDEELGGYPVVIVNDVSDDYGIATLSLANGLGGYQVSDYWLNYFRGVLQKYGDSDYLAFATREYINSSGYNNYINHYWLYVGDIENGGQITVYDCYSESNLYYVDVSTETISGINVDSFDTLAYSNLGHMSDLRTGVNHVESITLLFFLGFFTVYTVCRDLFSCIRRK